MTDIVIADFHHSSLFLSLMYLFEKRLGYTLYRPFGIEWWDHAYFSYPNEDFGKGVLQTESRVKELDPDKIDTSTETMGRMLNLKDAVALAREGRIRYMISSLHQSEPAFRRFINDFCPKGKTTLIRQVGNPNEMVRFTRHALCSDKQTYNRLGNEYHKILYRQEFNIKIFDWRSVHSQRSSKRIKSYLNFMSTNEPIYNAYKRIRDALPEIDWYEHGLQGEDGGFYSLSKMADSMADADMIISLKHWDGFGHCVHNAYAIGRPVISRVGDYEEKLAGELMKDMITAVKLTGDIETDKKKIRKALEPEYHAQMCWASYKRFKVIVDYDKEEIEIRKWLEEI